MKKQKIIVFELGHLEVFCYQTIEEWSQGKPAEAVYWQKKGEPQVYGPFASIYQAVNHYSDFIAKNKEPIPDNLIFVDFKAKKRAK